MPLKILVADDDYRIALTLSVILRRCGHTVRVACDGESAVEIALEWKPDILLTDVAMPGTNGFDAATRVRAVLPRCRVILHSTAFPSADEVRQPRSGQTDFEFLPKPAHPSILLEAVAGRRVS